MTPASSPPVARVVSLRESSLPALIEREHRRRRRRQLTWLGLALAVVAAAVAVFFSTRPRPAPLAARFRTGAVTQGDLVREVRATGHVEAVSTVSVGAEISGRVATVEADFNQQVKAGQVLARFDVAALEAQRAQSAAVALSAKAQLAQARADLEQARRNKARADSLFAQQAQAVSEHEAAVTALSIAVARVSASEATLAAQTALATVAKTNLEHAIIRSPIDGVIITRNIDPGQTVASMLATPVLFTVAADLRKMEVLAAVDEADIAEVAVGQRADFTVTAWPGRTFEGTVTEVRNAAHVVQDVVTYGVVVALDNLDLALRPGMTASVRVRTGSTAATLQVPNAALRFTPPGETKRERPHVWLLENGALVARAVTPALTDGERTAIAAGEVPAGAAVLVDLTPEGKKAYGLGAP
ncbi:MAG: efflux RND transporter periplasmic adaptor subunit [Archangium sp.]|nr:efflux RND transporter periplasmic adaptor subunit [Archangium sp.]